MCSRLAESAAGHPWDALPPATRPPAAEQATVRVTGTGARGECDGRFHQLRMADATGGLPVTAQAVAVARPPRRSRIARYALGAMSYRRSALRGSQSVRRAELPPCVVRAP